MLVAGEILQLTINQVFPVSYETIIIAKKGFSDLYIKSGKPIFTKKVGPFDTGKFFTTDTCQLTTVKS